MLFERGILIYSMKGEAKVDEALSKLERDVVSCVKCPRLVTFRQNVARRRRFLDWSYWGRPVPGFGDPNARLLVVGLAPAPHGGNRTGRVFTGDRSGDFLIDSLYDAGFANQPTSTDRDDGLRLRDAYLTAAVKCAPPDNTPNIREINNCSGFLRRELEIFDLAEAILCLGHTAYRSIMNGLMTQYGFRTSIPRFRHGLELHYGSNIPRIFASYHPSPRNTQTGKLTKRMFLAVLTRIKRHIGTSGHLARALG